MLRWDGLPIEDIRQVIDDPPGRRFTMSCPATGAAWNASETMLTAQLRDADRFLQEGITMPALPPDPGRPDQYRRR